MRLFGAFPDRVSYGLAGVFIAVAVLVAAGLAIVAYGVTIYRAQKLDQVAVQVQILAGSVTAAVAFDDPGTAQEYLDALRADPEIDAAAVYTIDGKLFAFTSRGAGGEVPRVVGEMPPTFNDNFVTVSRAVVQAGERVGYVYLRSTTEPLGRRLSRYAALLIILVMASLAVAVFLAAQGAVRGANAKLVAANDALRAEILQRQRAEEALLQTRKMEAIGQLSGGIAHDFNNILQALGASLNLIRRKPGEVDRVKRWAEAGIEIVERGAKLTGQLLAFSRLQRIELKSLVVSEVVAHMTDLLVRSLGPLIRISFQLDESRLPVLCDATQLEMAVLNLAVNARDAMPEGGELTISTRPCRIVDDPELQAGSYVELSVRDNGRGMPAEVAARAFDPFFTTKTTGKGTGLGLSQVYGIAKQAGGTARIESVPGQGTIVRIFLRNTDQQATETQRAVHRDGHHETPGSGTILVIDDDESVRGFLVDTLDDLGYRVAAASDGPSGLAMLAETAPDILLLDFAMPGMNGAEVAQVAHSRYPTLPIVFISGYADTAAIENAMGPQAMVMRKPFHIEELHDLLIRVKANARVGV